jgi:LemA protein
MTAGVVLVLIAVVAGVWALFVFNRLVRLRNQVRNAWADIDVQLKRRHDLIPPLVAAVKGYMGHERGVLLSVTELRAQATTLSSPAKLGDVESALGQALVPLLALKEAYPDLKANQNFLQLQRDLVEIEDHLQYARRFYNGAVRDNNTAVERIPDMFIARSFGFPEAEFFQAGEEDRAVVNVDLAS